MTASRKPYVSNEYARAFEAGALSALDWIASEYPDLDGPTMAAAEHIGHVVDLLLGNA